jgi:uncharacterized protein (TIGR02596 family)
MELLLVVTIIGLLAALAAGGLNNVARSSSLATAAQRLGDQIALARQSASSLNLPVEVRLYQLPEFDTTSGSPNLWRGLQIFSQDAAGNVTPLSKPVLFPNRVIISSNSVISPLLTSLTSTSPVVAVGSFPISSVKYVSFTIRPNGMVNPTSIADTNSFLTLHQQNEPNRSGDTKPANFITIQINPITSKVTLLRP